MGPGKQRRKISCVIMARLVRCVMSSPKPLVELDSGRGGGAGGVGGSGREGRWWAGTAEMTLADIYCTYKSLLLLLCQNYLFVLLL